MQRRLAALILSAHPVPSLAVSAIAVILGVGLGLEPWRLALVGAAFLANQLSVGLSNDWIDADRDRAVGRTDKPVAAGRIGAPTVRNTALVLAVAAVLLTLPLGWQATVAHAVFIASAWGYNLGLKSTVLSVLPYVVSFGLLPLIVTLASPEPRVAAPWAIGAGALIGVSAHFANVLPDLDDDHVTGVRGLPHRVGLRASGLVIAVALAVASGLVVLGAGEPISVYSWIGFASCCAIAVACAVLTITGRISRLLFLLILLGALIIVAMLALAGQRIVG
jgi:4-hydroxybenzoate polyprenyltransferase